MITALQIAGSLLGEIDWHAQDGFGYCRCPGADLHQNRSGKRDTCVYLAGVPTITCMHSSCAGVVAEKNRELRSTLGKLERGSNPGVRRFVKTPEQIAREAEKMAVAQLAAQAKGALPKSSKPIVGRSLTFGMTRPMGLTT